MIDTHCHLSYEYYKNLDEIINKMIENNIYCIVNGCNSKDSKEVIELSKKYKNIYAAIGYQPEYVDDLKENYIDFIEQNISNIIAIGEIGIDYHYTKENSDKQKEVFKRQLELAEKYNLPVIVHIRDSIQEVYDILKEYKVKGIIHAFNGSVEMANKFIKLGFKLGIGGVLTFKNCNLKDVIKQIYIENIVLETDSPYLSPEPVRGTINSPLNIPYIAEYIAKIKNISVKEVYKITNNTACTIFDINIKI